MQPVTKSISVTTASTIVATIGGGRIVGIRIMNTGAGALTAFGIWGRITSGIPVQVAPGVSMPGDPWDTLLSTTLDFATPEGILKAIVSPNDPTVLASGGYWAATLDLTYLSEVQLRATSASTSTVLFQIIEV